jgi:hypothetical protein
MRLNHGQADVNFCSACRSGSNRNNQSHMQTLIGTFRFGTDRSRQVPFEIEIIWPKLQQARTWQQLAVPRVRARSHHLVVCADLPSRHAELHYTGPHAGPQLFWPKYECQQLIQDDGAPPPISSDTLHCQTVLFVGIRENFPLQVPIYSNHLINALCITSLLRLLTITPLLVDITWPCSQQLILCILTVYIMNIQVRLPLNASVELIELCLLIDGHLYSDRCLTLDAPSGHLSENPCTTSHAWNNSTADVTLLHCVALVVRHAED